jgi:hypothetical protein
VVPIFLGYQRRLAEETHFHLCLNLLPSLTAAKSQSYNSSRIVEIDEESHRERGQLSERDLSKALGASPALLQDSRLADHLRHGRPHLLEAQVMSS